MMKKELVLVLALSQTLTLIAQLVDEDRLEVPEHQKTPQLTEEQRKYDELIHRVDRNMPYPGMKDLYEGKTTLGLLCRHADSIIIGRVTDVWWEDENDKKVDDETTTYGLTRKTNLDVTTNIVGKASNPTLKLVNLWVQGFDYASQGKRTFKSGDNVVLFLSDKQRVLPYKEVRLEREGIQNPQQFALVVEEKYPPRGVAAAWVWLKSLPSPLKKAPAKAPHSSGQKQDTYSSVRESTSSQFLGSAANKKASSKGPHLYGLNRGIIPFDGEEELSEYLAAVEGYIRYRQNWKEQSEQYYAFLRGMLKTSIFRIKEDARAEILHLVRSCPDFDVNLVLDDDTVDDGIKDYLRLIWIPGNPQTYPPQKFIFPKEEQ